MASIWSLAFCLDLPCPCSLLAKALCTALALAVFTSLVVASSIIRQSLFKDSHQPPVVPYWVPFFGSAVAYGRDPYEFFFRCREKYGDCFSFLLLGKTMTVCLGTNGNDLILNGRLQDVNAEEIYRNLTTPVFGSGVVYDCSNSVLMEQKKFLKFGLTTEALRSYVPLFEAEFYNFLDRSPAFRVSGPMNVNQVMAELTIFMASRTLQGPEVRRRFDSTFAELYHDLDMGFTPVNFMMPWLPLPMNRRRDQAQRKLASTYIEIIRSRRRSASKQDHEKDMIWHLMSSRYKNGDAIPDQMIAHMMIALLMAGQHSSSSIASWIMLRLASRSDVLQELYEEQEQELRDTCGRWAPLTFEAINRLPFNALVVKETLRLHAPIHSIMRAVKSPLVVQLPGKGLGDGEVYEIPTSHVLLSAPGVTAQSPEYFPSPEKWDPHRWESNSETMGRDEKIDYGYGLVTKGTSSPYLPFGAGRHRCIGEQFAYLQLGAITALMVREFKLSEANENAQMPKTDYTSLFTRPVDSAIIEFERRQNVEDTHVRA